MLWGCSVDEDVGLYCVVSEGRMEVILIPMQCCLAGGFVVSIRQSMSMV